MNDIDDLCRTLDQHAGAVPDLGVVARRAAVQHRISVARLRRRRCAGAAGGLVAAVALTVGGLTLLPGHDDQTPAPAATLVGVPAPGELSSLGYRFDLGSMVEGKDGRARVRLPASDVPRLVSWATSGDDDRVIVRSDTTVGPRVYDVGDFGDFVYVEAGQRGTVTVDVSEGRPGLAVYTLDPSVTPEGYSKDGVSYRQQAASGHLLGAEVGDPGVADLTVKATADTTGTKQYYFCSQGPQRAFVHVQTVGDSGASIDGAGSCEETPPSDGTTDSSVGYDTVPGQDQTTRIWVTDGEFGPTIDDPDLRIGLAVYGEPDAATTKAGHFAETIEEEGHSWRLVATRSADPGATSVTGSAPDGAGPALAVLYGETRSSVIIYGEFGGPRSGIYLDGTPKHKQAGMLNNFVNAGKRVTWGTEQGSGADIIDLSIAFYERAD